MIELVLAAGGMALFFTGLWVWNDRAAKESRAWADAARQAGVETVTLVLPAMAGEPT